MKAKKGQALVVTALAFTLIIALVGVAIDGGAAYLLRRQLQNAADAAAMAGTNYLLDHRFDAGFPLTAQVGTVAAVNSTAQANGVQPTDTVTITPVDGNSNPSAWTGTVQGVKVDISATRPTFFLRAVGIPNVTIPASATGAIINQPYGPNGPALDVAPGCTPPAGVKPMAFQAFPKSGQQVATADINNKLPGDPTILRWDMVIPVGETGGQSTQWKCGDTNPVLVTGQTYPANPADNGNQAVASLSAELNQNGPFITAVPIIAESPDSLLVTPIQFWIVRIDAVDTSLKTVTLEFIGVYPGERLTA